MKILIKKCFLLLLFFIAAKTISAQVNFNIPANSTASTVNKIEYFIDVDPGFGNGNSSVTFTPGVDVTISNASISIAGLSNGVHKLYTRSKNTNGKWSHTNVNSFFIVNLTTTFPANGNIVNINKAEYFIDTDPGFGNGINIPVATNTDVSVTNFAVNINGLTNGVHRIYTRSKTVNGKWSQTNVNSFFIVNLTTSFPQNGLATNINKLEYFVDVDPGFGSATNIPITNVIDATVNNYAITIGNLSTGIHRLYVRSKNISGKWAVTNVQLFAVVNNITIPANKPAGLITKLEYFIDTDPGFGNGTIVNITPTIDLNNFSFVANIGILPIGSHKFYIRSFDTWGLTNVFPFDVNMPLPLKLLNFSAQKNGTTIDLIWKTTNEINTKYFDVERSKDGINFGKITKVDALQNLAPEKLYNSNDNNLPVAILYYRLKMVDVDGRFTYSPIVRINNNKLIVINIYPNPATSIATIELPVTIGKNIAINILNAQGQLVKQIVQTSAAQVQINISELSSGMYNVFVTDGQNKYAQKLIIKH